MERMNERTRTTSPPASGVRVSAWRALAVFACAAVALVVSFLFPCYAFADDYQDVWNHQSKDGGQQYIVGAYNAYDAAAFVCGYTSSAVGGWDLSIRAKLSNAPAIVAMAEGFGNVTPWNDELLRDTCEQYFGSDLWNKMQSTYGGVGGIHVNSGGLNSVQLKYWQDNMPAGMHVYALNTTSEAVGAAREAFRAILAGEDTGGSSGGGSGIAWTGTVELYSSNSNGTYSGTAYTINGVKYVRAHVLTSTQEKNGSQLVPSSVTYHVDQPSNVTGLPEDLSGYTSIARYGWDSSGSYLKLYLVPKDTQVTYVNDAYTGDSFVGSTPDFHVPYCLNYSSSNRAFGQETFIFDGLSTQTVGQYVANGAWSSRTVGGGSSEPEPDPPNNWPDNDTNTTVAPSPPELPTPKDPTIPTEPDPDPPTYYTPPTPDPPSTDPPYEPTEPTGTSPTDYTPWLRAILNALGGISANMATHCQHLQAQMKAQATRIIQGINNQLVNLGTSINGAIGDWAKWLGECWGEGLNTLTDNLYDLFHWLAEQFDFTFSGDPYDDSGIIGWLRRIYDRLGNGGDPKHYAPTILDPGSEGEEEPFDFWSWLLERIASIIGGVLGGATDAVSTLLEGIRGKFPFSIPWDLLAFLGMLSGDRAIPVFTFTIPAIQGWWGEVPIRVDLTPYDSAAQACRTMVLIWWAFVLAMKSTWMINDVLGAVGSSIVSRFTGRLVGTAS